MKTSLGLLIPLALCGSLLWAGDARLAASRPNIVFIMADDLGYADLGCYGSEINTPHIDRLAREGVRFTQFYNAGRCCPTRASLLTGLYPHQAGVGHMLSGVHPPSYSNGLLREVTSVSEALQQAGYRTYHVGKWHVGGVGQRGGEGFNHPLNRGFHRAYGMGGGGNYFGPRGLFLDRQAVQPGDDYYVTDAFSDYAVGFIERHGREQGDQPFFMHLCYTAPHFPLHAKPADIARYRGRYREGWDVLRQRRFARQRELGLLAASAVLSPRDPLARAWDEVPESERDEWDLRMAVYAAMIDCMDQGIGRVLEAIRRIGAESDTLVVFVSDNGSSAEALDSWPTPARGHKPGSETGTRASHRCLEVGWSNAANTPFREHKMWAHEGGIITPLIAYWPEGIGHGGALCRQVGHVIDLAPTFLELAGAEPLTTSAGDSLPGHSLVAALGGSAPTARHLGWEHEGNRAWREGDWKIVAAFRHDWELYDLAADPTETNNLANAQPERVKQMAARWQAWADAVGVVPWEQLPGANYRPTAEYRKKSEPFEP